MLRVAPVRVCLEHHLDVAHFSSALREQMQMQSCTKVDRWVGGFKEARSILHCEKLHSNGSLGGGLEAGG